MTPSEMRIGEDVEEIRALRAENERLRKAITDALSVNISLPYGLREQFEAALAQTEQTENAELKGGL